MIPIIKAYQNIFFAKERFYIDFLLNNPLHNPRTT